MSTKLGNAILTRNNTRRLQNTVDKNKVQQENDISELTNSVEAELTTFQQSVDTDILNLSSSLTTLETAVNSSLETLETSISDSNDSINESLTTLETNIGTTTDGLAEDISGIQTFLEDTIITDGTGTKLLADNGNYISTFTKPLLISPTERISILDTVLDTVSVTDMLVEVSSLFYFTTELADDFDVNFAASTNDLNTNLTVGQSLYVAMIVTNGDTAYTLNSLTIDDTAQTILWAGGTAPSGVANSLQTYTFTVIKTADATFTVLGAVSDYAAIV